MLTWHSQVTASLRKLIWRADASEGLPYLRNELLKERAALRGLGSRHNPVGTERLPKATPMANYRDVFADEIDHFADAFAFRGERLSDDSISIELDDRDIVIGALYGGSIDLRDLFERPDPIHELA